mgnify:CR=1 FL=1
MLEVFQDLDALSRAAARRIVALGSEAVAARGRFDWLLAGGSTPERTYDILAAEHRDRHDLWRKTHFYWGDERCVPPQDPQSNYALAERSLLTPLAIPAENIHRVRGEASDREAAAAQYEAVLPDRADLVLLGLGEDGHTASLFPDSPALEEEYRRVLAVDGAKAPKQRITVTPPVLRAARGVMVLVSGKAKAEALRLALAAEGDVRRTPARLVRHGVWLADREAASALACPAW